jgi:glycosyltransferase 2 family protein
VTYVHGLSAFFVERLVDMLSMILVASLAAYAFPGTRWLVVVTLLVTLAFLPVVHSQVFYDFLERRRQALSSARLRTMGERLLSMLRSSADLLKSGPLYLGLLLGLLAWFAEGYALYIVLERMGANTPIYVAAGIYGVSVLAGAVSFVPGGLGGTELVMGSLLVLSGVDAPTAVSAVIICRLATLWFAVALGLSFVVGVEFSGLGKRPAGQQGAAGSQE